MGWPLHCIKVGSSSSLTAVPNLLFTGDESALAQLISELYDNGVFAYELQQSNVISALLSFFSVTAPAASDVCSTPLGRDSTRSSLKEWLRTSWDSLADMTDETPLLESDVLPATVVQARRKVR